MLTPQELQLVYSLWDNKLVDQLTPENEYCIIEIVAGDYIGLSGEARAELEKIYAEELNLAPLVVRDSKFYKYLLGPADHFALSGLLKVASGENILFGDNSDEMDPAINLTGATDLIDLPVLDNKGNISKSVVKREKIPRPANAFILYRKDHHPVIVAANPGICNNQISEILGRQWRNECTEIREHYHRLARDLKEEHLAKHPGYTYHPRKSSEKKRRMTKKKAAALAAAQATPSFQLASQYPQNSVGGLATSQAGNIQAQLPLTPAMIKQVNTKTPANPDAITKSQALGFTPSQEYNHAQVGDAAVRRQAFQNFLRTGIFSVNDVNLITFLEEHGILVPISTTPSTVTPGAYMVTAKRPSTDGYHS